MEFGLEWNNPSIEYQSSFADTIEVSNLIQKTNIITSYFQYSYQPVSKIKLTPGIRISYFGQTNRLYAEPRLSAFYYLSEYLYIKGAIGRYFQYISRLYVPDSYGGYSDFWALADGQDIPVISANHYIVGFNFKKGNFSLDAEFYKKEINGLSEFRFEYDSLSLESSSDFYSGKAFIQGMDIIIKNRFGPLTGWISYSLSKNENQFSELNQGKAFPANNHKKHELKVAALLKIKKWDLSTTWIYSSGLPFTIPSKDGVFVYDMTDMLNTNTLPDYHRLDISATFNYVIKKVNGKVGISVLNVYNQKNIKSRLYLPDDISLEPIPVDIKHIGFTPGVFINVNF
jgi:outer membrane cobalamin receptor